MGIIFGKVTVEEPAFDVLLHRPHASTSYDVRKYGERFAIETEYTAGMDEGTPFRLLAGYIGVFGEPQNEGGKSISMSAPVVRQDSSSQSGGTAIAMTAPVVRKNDNDEGGEVKKMQFILPAEYDVISKIPKPTNPAVKIAEVPPSVGAVHRFHGSFKEQHCHEMATALTKQLETDGVDISEEEALEHYQFWGYNPPFTIPVLRRNEVYIELTEAQAGDLLQTFGESSVPKN